MRGKESMADRRITGQFIAKRRKMLNLTQEQLAERLGVSNKTLSKWETGKCMPDYGVVERLCDELGVTIGELLDGWESEAAAPSSAEDGCAVDLLRRTQELERQRLQLVGVAADCPLRRDASAFEHHRRQPAARFRIELLRRHVICGDVGRRVYRGAQLLMVGNR